MAYVVFKDHVDVRLLIMWNYGFLCIRVVWEFV